MALLRADGELHVWLMDIDHLDGVHPAFDESLSSEEKLRAARFVAERDRRSFVIAHAAVRHILSMYVGVRPGSIRFEVGPYGKPMLAGIPDMKIGFNLSHSGDFAICAVANACDVGVDIEQIQPAGILAGVARQFFSAEEQRFVADLDVDERAEASTRIWVRKEACLKAAGRGIGGDLRGFSVRIDGPGTSVPTADDRGVIWALQELVAPERYCAAAATSVSLKLKTYRFEDFPSAI